MLVKNGRGRAEQVRIAGEEMLVTIDRYGALLDNAGADAVRAFVFFAPDAARPKSRAVTERIVARRAAAVDDDAIRVRQYDRTADAADGKSRSMLAWAAKSNEPIRSRDRAICSSGSRWEGARLAGSSACSAPDRRQEAASAELAASLPAMTLRT